MEKNEGMENFMIPILESASNALALGLLIWMGGMFVLTLFRAVSNHLRVKREQSSLRAHRNGSLDKYK